MARLTDIQAEALLAWANLHGRYWKDSLRQAWRKSYYGVIRADHAAALQGLRNEAASALNAINMHAVQAQVHALHMRQAAQSLVDKLTGGCPGVATTELVRLQGLLQLSPPDYDGRS